MDQDLISHIYEAAVMPEKWPDVIERIALHVGARGGNLIRNSGSEITLQSSPAIREVAREFERQGWHNVNTRITRLVERSWHPGFLTDLDLHTLEEIRTLPMYVEFLTPHGGEAGAATIIQGANDEALAISFEAFLDHDAAWAAVPALDGLRPHLARAVSLSSEIARVKAETLVTAFDTMGSAVALLDRAGRIVSATRAFTATLDDLLYDGPARMRVADPLGDRSFAEALLRLQAGEGGRSIALRDQRHAGQAVLHLLPAKREARDVFSKVWSFAVIGKPGNRLVPNSNIIGALFDMTPAEANIARSIAAGQKPAEIAGSLGISVETVRTHLKKVFLKTSTGHQTELALLMTNFASPLDETS